MRTFPRELFFLQTLIVCGWALRCSVCNTESDGDTCRSAPPPATACISQPGEADYTFCVIVKQINPGTDPEIRFVRKCSIFELNSSCDSHNATHQVHGKCVEAQSCVTDGCNMATQLRHVTLYVTLAVVGLLWSGLAI